MKRTFLDQKAKEALRKGVRALRVRLIQELTDEAKSEYQLDIGPEKAKLHAAGREKRRRLEEGLRERARLAPKAAKAKAKSGEVDETELRLAAAEAAHTLLNRLTFLRILEHHQVLKPAVVTNGWDSPAFAQEFAHYGAQFKDEPSRGYLALLDAVYAELALDLPALFGPVGLTALFPVPVPTLRAVLELLSDPTLDSAWGDDTTLGWVYQFWNDPERERLDEKIASGGKIEPHELGPKTQMFTERYMVEWLLHNTLGQTWLAMCAKQGWSADFARVRDKLEARRASFRRQREAGEVPLDALMPIEGELEERWKYWVPQPLPPEAVSAAPETLQDLKLLDPACGSGHFLVIAFDLLAALYEEEARHRGESWSASEIAQWIVERNLHGIDIDARAIQLSAASLWLKAKLYAPDVPISRMNLVAPVFRLGALPKDDPSLVRLCDELARFVVPKAVTLKLVEALSGVDHLGTLLRVDEEIAALLEGEQRADEPLLAYTARKVRGQVLDRLTDFLDEHAAEADLGLRLEGEQVEAGMRFVGIAKRGRYDIVVANPPYQGLTKTANLGYVSRQYVAGKADLYAAFLMRGVELCRPSGLCAMVTMQGWMFLSQFTALRQWIIEQNSLRCVGDLMWCAFENMRHATVAMAVIAAGEHAPASASAVAPTPRNEREESIPALAKKKAALLVQVGRHEFDVARLSGIEGTPLVYWWDEGFLAEYIAAPKVASLGQARQGLGTRNDTRFTRKPWEVRFKPTHAEVWVPFVKGAAGQAWIGPIEDLLLWRSSGFELEVWIEHYRTRAPGQYIKNREFYFKKGIAFSPIGMTFLAREHRVPCVFGEAGSSVFAEDIAGMLCSMNSSRSRNIASALNPTINFKNEDVNRLPVFPCPDAGEIVRRLREVFSEHESHREPSVEFRSVGHSAWRSVQSWAQLAVDRPNDENVPPYNPELEPADPIAHISAAVGQALGRFGGDNEGVVFEPSPLSLADGIMYLANGELLIDSLKEPEAERIVGAWKEHCTAILQGKRQSLRDWLKKDFFRYHLSVYENRPIYFPLASDEKNFVAFISIHRWTDRTLQDLLALHLAPALRQLSGEIVDLNKDRTSSDKAKSSAAEKQFTRTKRLHDELSTFIAVITECAERGAPPTDASCPPRAQHAKFRMDLDDGVMINSAALWPLLEPLWPKPKTWWKELCQAKGRKDYDWSHLARRYFPERVDEKCRQDPSLGVAHGCFWKYHPAKAYAWELRLQHEIKPDFTIDEPDSDACRARFLEDHPDEAAAIREKEQLRRERAEKKKLQADGESVDAETDDSADAAEDEEA